MTTNAPDSITMYKRHTVKELSRAVELRASPTTNHEHQPLNGNDLCRLMGGTKDPPPANQFTSYIYTLSPQ
jgi:hypothetical protein